ncbi:uncharacterized protein JCM15063_001280 [Sporobolomyces koalae]|uniref:uncharacterized protein n=1 Tax=Sporobolomyces koalae TaxID=500713 RepID=UPI0031736AD1
MDRPTPRVNARKLAECSQGQVVRLVGKVITLTEDEALLETTDGAQVTVRLDRQTNLQDTFVETIGKYQGDMIIDEMITQNLGDKLGTSLSAPSSRGVPTRVPTDITFVWVDMDLANKAVELTHTLPEVFPTD